MLSRRDFLSSVPAAVAVALAPSFALADADPVEAARLDPNAFIEYVTSGPGQLPFVQDACHERWQAAFDGHRALIKAPAGSGKTVQALYRVLWEIGRNPEISVRLVVDVMTARSSRRARRLMAEEAAANERVAEVFPVLRSLSWVQSPDGLELGFPHAKRPTVDLIWLGSNRPFDGDLFLCDGLECYSNSATPCTRRKTWDLFNERIASLDARVIVLGWPGGFHEQGLTARLSASGEWVNIRDVAVSLDEHGTEQSLVPHLKSVEDWRARSRDLGPRQSSVMLGWSTDRAQHP